MNVRARGIGSVVLGALAVLGDPALAADDASLAVSPLSVTVAVGESVSFEASARLTGASASPLWSSIAGSWSLDPKPTWTAPWAAGTYELAAIHPLRADVVARIAVTVTARPPSITPLASAAYPAAPSLVRTLGQSMVAAWADGVAYVVSGADSKIVLAFPSTTLPAWGADGDLAFAAAGKGATVFHTTTPASSAVEAVADFGTFTSEQLALHPSSRLVASSKGSTVSVYDTRTGFSRIVWNAPAPITGLEWTRPGGLLAIGAGGRVFLHALGGEDPVAVPMGDRGLHCDDTGWLGAVSAEGEAAVIQIRDPYTVYRIPADGDPIVSAETTWYFEHDVFVLRASGAFERWDEKTATRVWSLPLSPRPSGFALTMSSDGYVWMEAGLALVDLVSGRRL